MAERDTTSLLLAVPNFSEGRDHDVLEAIERRLRAGALSRPSRGSRPQPLRVHALPAVRASLRPRCSGRRARRSSGIDLSGHEGLHPYVGALDVVPVVYLDEAMRGAACAEALTAAALIGEELELPVFLYGELATRPEHVERPELRARRAGGAGRAHGGGRAGAGLRAPPRRTRPPGAVLVTAGRRWSPSTSTS